MDLYSYNFIVYQKAEYILIKTAGESKEISI